MKRLVPLAVALALSACGTDAPTSGTAPCDVNATCPAPTPAPAASSGPAIPCVPGETCAQPAPVVLPTFYVGELVRDFTKEPNCHWVGDPDLSVLLVCDFVLGYVQGPAADYGMVPVMWVSAQGTETGQAYAGYLTAWPNSPAPIYESPE